MAKPNYYAVVLDGCLSLSFFVFILSTFAGALTLLTSCITVVPPCKAVCTQHMVCNTNTLMACVLRMKCGNVLVQKSSAHWTHEFSGIANVTTERRFSEYVETLDDSSCIITNNSALYNRVLELHLPVSLKEVVEDEDFKLGLVCAREYMPDLAVEVVDLIGKMVGTVVAFVKQKKL